MTNDQATFSESQRQVLLKVKGVGPSVLRRLEEIGVSSMATLRECDAREVTHLIAANVGSTCWKNSPQAIAAIESAIKAADAFMMNHLGK